MAVIHCLVSIQTPLKRRTKITGIHQCGKFQDVLKLVKIVLYSELMEA